jgi:hypothetical protein
MQVKQECNMPDETTSVDWSNLVGKFFHELGEDGYVERQGIIVGEPYPQVFVVTYFEWITGSPSWGERLFTLDNILQGEWRFYPTIEDMREAYEYGGIARPQS